MFISHNGTWLNNIHCPHFKWWEILILKLQLFSLLLGLPCGNVSLCGKRHLYDILSFAARKNVLLHWISDKSQTGTTFLLCGHLWDTSHAHCMKKRTCSLRCGNPILILDPWSWTFGCNVAELLLVNYETTVTHYTVFSFLFSFLRVRS